MDDQLEHLYGQWDILIVPFLDLVWIHLIPSWMIMTTLIAHVLVIKDNRTANAMEDPLFFWLS